MALKFITAEKEYEKNKELNKDDLDSLFSWAEKQPHLPKISEVEMIIFLHSCHWSVELTKKTIDYYYTYRTHVPEFFANRYTQHDAMINMMNVYNFFILHDVGPKGETIFYGALRNKNYTFFNFAEAIKYFMLISDLMLCHYGTFNSFLMIIDLDGVTLGHVTRLGIMTMKKILVYLQDAMPVRLAGIHFIHPVPFMDKILGLMRPFLKPELANSLLIHSTMDAFYKHVIKEKLPTDLGGQYETIDSLNKKWQEHVSAHSQFFKDEEKQRVNEARRPGKAQNAGELFGVEGSFKKLAID